MSQVKSQMTFDYRPSTYDIKKATLWVAFFLFADVKTLAFLHLAASSRINAQLLDTSI